MSLKDELEKLIAEKKALLDEQKERAAEFSSRQKQRFQLMQSLLSELQESVEEEYLTVSCHDSFAEVDLGAKQANFSYSWRIEPNSEYHFGGGEGQSGSREKPGFRVEETQHRTMPEYETIEETLEFETERDALEHIMQEVARSVAIFRSWKEDLSNN